MALKIMVVDDEPAMLDLFKAWVEPMGYDVRTFADSREAAERLSEEKFDGIFVDVRMPHLDGFELTQRIRKTPLNRQVPIVMLTGLDDVDTMRKGFSAGISFFLGKPFTRERLYSLFGAVRGGILREKRRCARLPLRIRVTCTWGGYRAGHCVSGSVDISEGGMSLKPSCGLDVGQELDLEFSMPMVARQLKPHAKVVRRDASDQIGVQFLDLSVHDGEAIESYLAERIKD